MALKLWGLWCIFHVPCHYSIFKEDHRISKMCIAGVALRSTWDSMRDICFCCSCASCAAMALLTLSLFLCHWIACVQQTIGTSDNQMLLWLFNMGFMRFDSIDSLQIIHIEALFYSDFLWRKLACVLIYCSCSFSISNCI